MKLRKQQGLVLAAMVMLMVIASITVLGVSIFVVERLEQAKLQVAQTAAVNLAEAGIHQALYDFRFHDLSGNGYFTLGQSNVTAEKFFVIGAGAGDLLMVNTSAAVITTSGSNRFLSGLTMQNATNSQSITIDRMIVTWNKPSTHLREITINGSSVWTGDTVSPTDANITNVTLNTVPSTVTINSLWFAGSMSNADVNIQFVMTDGSIRSIDVFPASDQFNFWVNATGKTTLSNIWKTTRANYNAITATVEDYLEINTQITP